MNTLKKSPQTLLRAGAVILSSMAVLPLQAAGFGDCPEFFAGGKPPVVAQRPLQRELCYDAFAILHSGETKTPVFVAQKLNRALVADADEKRTNRFFADARLPSAERTTMEDYKGAFALGSYTKGHMAPAGDMPTAQAMAQSFSLANIVPQVSGHNSGPWQKVERDTRNYASRAEGDVFIITGPVFEPNGPTIGSGVRVPKYIFKLVYDATRNQAWAHWQENRAGKQDARPISYDELVKRTGVNFLPMVKFR